MCQPKYWNKIYVGELQNHYNNSVLAIFAERSDLEIFELEIVIKEQESLSTIADKVRKAINSLESYRDCDCTAKLGSCIKHLNDVIIEQSLGPKSAVTFGRR
jgi:hypothetical protein